MSGFEHDLGVSRWSRAGQWAAGTLRSLMTIAASALVVWIAVFAINASGLLERPAQAEPRSPVGGSPFARVAYG